MRCIACGRALTNDIQMPNWAAWTYETDPNFGDRWPYCGDSADCRRDAEAMTPGEAMRTIIDELFEQRDWPAHLVDQARAACAAEDFQTLDNVLSRLDRLGPSI